MSWTWKSRTQQVAGQVKAAAEDGLQDVIELMFDDSQAAVPVATGRLKRSGRIAADGLKRAIVYDSAIAVGVHEDMTAHHDDGRAKFLESAINQNRAAAGGVIARTIRSELQL